MSYQPSLFGQGAAPSVDAGFSSLARTALDDAAWVDYAPGWVRGADLLFEQVRAERAWAQRSRPMYEQYVREPRLTSSWNAASGERLAPPLEQMRAALAARYGLPFDSIGFNFYRDGRDSVAWHRDHILPHIDEPVVALVSLGEPRKFLLRPVGGGASRAFLLGRGDLLVTGGRTQRTWEHTVPKVKHAGPRISLAFRYGMDPRVYARKRVEPDVV